jgi:hypothetical protein
MAGAFVGVAREQWLAETVKIHLALREPVESLARNFRRHARRPLIQEREL